jgi:hypothetical protein
LSHSRSQSESDRRHIAVMIVHTGGMITAGRQIHCSTNWLHGIAYGHESEKRRWQPHGEMFSKIRFSVALSLGRIEHWNSPRCLEIRTLSYEMQLWSRIWTYATARRSVDTATLTGISLPLWSFAFATLNTDRTDEATMKIIASAR